MPLNNTDKRLDGQIATPFRAFLSRHPFSDFSAALNVSKNRSKKVQKIVDTFLALWDSQATHGNK
jgi:hypothetical protein